MNTAIISLIMMSVVFSILIPTTLGTQVTLYPDTVIHVGNENYTINPTRSFNYITMTPVWLRLDTLDMNITSASPINITITYMNSNMHDTTHAATMLSLTASATSGLTTFTIGGFLPNDKYYLYKDSTYQSTITTTATGELVFTNDVWSTHTFSILYHTGGYIPATGPGSTTTNNIVQVILPIMLVVVLLIYLLVMFYTGMLDVKTMIIWLAIMIIGIITIIGIT